MLTDSYTFIYDEEDIKKDTEYFLGENGAFKKEIDSFVPRESQLLMSKKWEECLNNNEIFVCEAGTGTGKTFAYLIPAILSGKSVLVSTATKALQDQLVTKDLPRLFELLKVKPDYMALKGFDNYLCLRNYFAIKEKYFKGNSLGIEDPIEDEEDLDSGLFTKDTFDKIEGIMEYSNRAIEENGPNPDFAEVNSKFSSSITSKITCTSDACVGRKCLYQKKCYAFLARRKAIESKLLVINHSLFFSGIQIQDITDSEPVIFPIYKTVILDESHELASFGRESLSAHLGTSDIKKMKRDLRVLKSLKNGDIPLKAFEERVKGLAQVYGRLLDYLHERVDDLDSKLNFLFLKYDDFDEKNNDPFFEYQEVNTKFRNLMGDIYMRLKEYRNFVSENMPLEEDFLGKLKKYLNDKLEIIINLMKIDDKKQLGYGHELATAEIEVASFDFSITPLEISNFFGSYLDKCLDLNISVLFTSATLCVKHSFKKFLRDIGLDEQDTSLLELNSNFNYQEQAALYYSKDFPEANAQRRIEEIVDRLSPLIDKLEGGVFFLTTSKEALNYAFIKIHSKFGEKRKVFCQGRRYSNIQMIQRFKQEGNAILVGTSSFWAGVDVPGNALSLVIIDKLPFESPSDPIFKARCNLYDIDAKDKGFKPSFVAISVPEAVIKLRQGVGRLIRHEDDIGGLIICDPRLESKSYGKIFLKSLPDMKEFKNIYDLIVFLDKKGKLRKTSLK